jgi:hypothetical protein
VANLFGAQQQIWDWTAHLTGPRLCTGLTERVYIDRCFTWPVTEVLKSSPWLPSVDSLFQKNVPVQRFFLLFPFRDVLTSNRGCDRDFSDNRDPSEGLKFYQVLGLTNRARPDSMGRRVVARHGSGHSSPTPVPDLIGVKDRKPETRW